EAAELSLRGELLALFLVDLQLDVDILEAHVLDGHAHSSDDGDGFFSSARVIWTVSETRAHLPFGGFACFSSSSRVWLRTSMTEGVALGPAFHSLNFRS